MGGLISPEYIEQNRRLHEMRPDYGSHGLQWADRVIDLMVRLECKTILDYGSGKGELARHLADLNVIEYDPAIPGKGVAIPADLVVCTDVLEHIEPAMIDKVIDHIWDCCNTALFFSICTVPARKQLPDGRNPHLIVEKPEWWIAKLKRKFAIERYVYDEEHVIGEALPLKPIGKIECKSAVEDEERNRNVIANCKRTRKRLDVGERPPHDRTAILVCNGPSLAATWPQIAMARVRSDVDIFSVSTAHRFLLEHRIVPLAHMECDPREHKVRQIGRPCGAVQYWLASCVHPSWLDLLLGDPANPFDVSLWHSYNGKASTIAFNLEPHVRMVIGGGSIGLRALSVLYCRGYRAIEIHGMDSSFADDGSAYANEHLGKEKVPIRVQCGDRWFTTSAVMILYARYFQKHCLMLPDLNIKLHGDGLLQQMERMARS